jgi:hypothetical protein
MMQRQIYHFTDTGTQTKTGRASGVIKQMRWHLESGDTGGTIAVRVHPDEGDTGTSYLILNSGLTPDFTRAPVLPGRQVEGNDTGVDTDFEYVAANEKVTVTIVPPAASTGKLYIWSQD